MKCIFPIFLALFLISCSDDDPDPIPTGGGTGTTDPNTESGFPDQYFQADVDGEAFLLQADHSQNVMAGMMAHNTNCYYNYGMNIAHADLNQPIFAIMHYIYHFPPDCNDSSTFEGLWAPGSMEYAEMEGNNFGEGVLISYKPANSSVTYSSAHGNQTNASYNITEVIPLGDDYFTTLYTFGTFVGLKGTFNCTLYSPQDPSDSIELTNGEFYTLVQGIDEN
jgi:hypothetical protein